MFKVLEGFGEINSRALLAELFLMVEKNRIPVVKMVCSSDTFDEILRLSELNITDVSFKMWDCIFERNESFSQKTFEIYSNRFLSEIITVRWQ